MAERSRLQLDERRAQLLELGLELFGARAYDEVSIDDIARQAGVSKGLLYHYFGGKRAFYVETVRAAAEQLRAATEPDPELPGPQRAQAGLIGYLDFVEARGGSYLALMRGGIGVDQEIVQIIEASRQTFIDRMLQGIGLQEPRPVFRIAARAWIGSVEASSLDWIEHRDVERATLVSLLLQSLLATLTIAKNLDPGAGIILDG